MRGCAANVCLALVLLFSPAGQSAAPGNLSGIVYTIGADGLQVGWPNARVTLLQIATKSAHSTVSSPTGDYSFSGLASGDYELTVALEGFETLVQRIKIDKGDKHLDVQLQPRGQRTRVTVAGEKVAIDPSSPESQSLGEMRLALKSAILLDEQFQEVLPLIPGVLRGPDGLLHIKGARSTQSGAIVNSASVVDPVNGLSTLSLPLEAVNNVRVLPNPFSVEYGRFTGGLVEVQTRSGSDDWRVGLHSFWPRVRFRDGSINGIRAFTPRFDLSGPLAKGRAYIFQAIDYHFVRTRVPSLNPPLDETVLESFDSFTQLDINLNVTNKLSLSFGLYPQNLSFVNLNTFFPQATAANFRQRGFHVTANERAIFGAGGFLDSTFSAKRFDAHTFPARFAAAGLELIPEQNAGGWHYRQDRQSYTFQWSQAYNFAPRHARGYHFLLAGYSIAHSSYDGAVDYLPVTVRRADGTRTQFLTYGPPASLKAGKIDFAVFFQDRWQIKPRVALDLGIRLDREDLSGDVVDLAPRLALVVAPTADNRTTIRAGLGFFYDGVPLQLGTFMNVPRMTLTNFAADGATITTGPRTFDHVRVTDDGELHAPRALAWNVQLDRELSRQWILRFSYHQRRVHGDFYLQPFEAPGLAQVQLRDDGETTYREFESLLRWAASERTVLFFSYVHSRAEGDLNPYETHFGNFPAPLLRPNQRGPLPFDTPHRMLLWGTIGLPWKLEFFPVLDISSGFPFSSVDSDWNYVGRRNEAGRFPMFVAFDFQISRQFKFKLLGRERRLTLGARLFNLTSHFNPRDVQQNLFSPHYGTFYNSIERKFRTRIGFDF
jgi:hypothetical protein